jgi:HEAT repeat protein
MVDQVLRSLVDSQNEAADDVVLECLGLGTLQERLVILGALLKRESIRGLTGIIETYDDLPQPLQLEVMSNIGVFHHALRECGRSDRVELRLAAMKLIAIGHQGKLAYVLSENLYEQDDALVQGAVEALVALGRWISMETRKLQTGSWEGNRPRMEVYRELTEQRPELEAAIARALDGHRGKFINELVRASLLLCDWPGSKTLAVLNTVRHGGKGVMQRRLQEPPASEHVDAFLLGSAYGPLRAHFGNVFAHIEDKPVLDALLRRTYLLKDNALQTCMHQVQRGLWWAEDTLAKDIERRDPTEAARIAAWIGCSGLHDAVQDDRLASIAAHAVAEPAARLQILRVAASRRHGGSLQLIKKFLADPDERIARLAAREFIRRRPTDSETALLQMMATSPESIRRIIGRAVGQSAFDQFWNRYERLEKTARKQAGRAMLKVVPDAVSRLARKLNNGPTDQRLRALIMTQELNLGNELRESLIGLTRHANPKVRSKAITVIGELPSAGPDLVLDRVLIDDDARVRANAIEVLESKRKTEYIPLLTQRARNSHNRERANAIKALHQMKVGTAADQLTAMLLDQRPEHRVSGLWALRHMGLWKLIQEVGRLAKEDENMRVRRYAFNVLKAVAEQAQAQKQQRKAS